MAVDVDFSHPLGARLDFYYRARSIAAKICALGIFSRRGGEL